MTADEQEWPAGDRSGPVGAEAPELRADLGAGEEPPPPRRPAGKPAEPGEPLSGRRASTLVSAGILLSRVAGLGREAALAHFLGAGLALDAFRAAVKIPNALQNLLGEGVLSASFIPVYARLLADDDDEEEAGRVAGAIAGLLAAVAGFFIVVGVVFARPLTALFAPGFSGQQHELTVTLVRILTPGVGVLVLSAWCLGVLNSHRRFFLPYVAPVLWNGAQIAVLVAFGLAGVGDATLATALAWGVFAGGLLQFGVQVPTVRRLVRHLRLSVRTDLVGVRTALRRFVPVVAGRGVVQLAGFVELALASLLAVSAISFLTFAQVLYMLPISLFGMGVAAAELPELSRLRSPAADRAMWARRVDNGLARVAFFVVPTSLAYLVLGDLVVGALLQRGEFGPAEARAVWFVLAAFTIGLLATTSGRLLQNTLYASGDARGPARIAAIRVACSIVLGAALMFQFDRFVLDAADFGVSLQGQLPAFGPLEGEVRRQEGVMRLGAVGLALASGITAWLELELLRRRVAPLIGRPRVGGGFLVPIVIASVAAGLVALGLRWLVGDLHPIPGLLLAGVPTGVVYLVVTTLFDVPEATAMTARARRVLQRR